MKYNHNYSHFLILTLLSSPNTLSFEHHVLFILLLLTTTKFRNAAYKYINVGQFTGAYEINKWPQKI